MNITLADTPEAARVEKVAEKLTALCPGEVLTVTCEQDPGDLARSVGERASAAYDHQTVHIPRKKGDVWLLHLKRRHRP